MHKNDLRPDEPERLRSLDDLCQWLNMPKKTIYRWTSDRMTAIPFYRIGKHLRFKFSEVNLWLQKYHASEYGKEFQILQKQLPEKK